MLLEAQVAFGRTASGQDRGVAGIKKLLHLLLFTRSGVHMTMTVDESRHCRHAVRIDGLDPRNIRCPPGHRGKPPISNDDGAAVDDSAVPDNDSGVRDY